MSVPLWQATGGSVLITLGWLAAPAALAALLWLPQLRQASSPAAAPADPAASADPAAPAAPPASAAVAVYRHALAWQVMFFMGLQSLIYYATLSWLPTILRDRGESAAGPATCSR